MKNKLLLLLLLLSAWSARAQTATLAQESFETDGEGTRYTSNSFDGRTSAASVAGAFPYFTRALTNPFVNPLNTAYVSFGTNAYPVTIGNVTGSVFWAGEAVESTATTPAANDRPPGVVTLNPINASNYSSLTMTVALADARGPSSPTITQGGLNPQNETNDVIRLQYSTDGGASYNTIGQFVGNNSTGTGQGYMQLDVNKDGAITSLDGVQSAANTLDINLRDFSFPIPGSPTALLVRVQFDQRGASEELAFDNIRVTGVLNTVAPPVLANIESSALNYLEGQAATPITSTLTVTNSAGNLSGATVTISSGRAAAQDVLVFTNQNGITGSYNTSTGVLTLTGMASAATYQAALRSVAFQNTNSANATAGTRTIQFVVANGSTTSGVASRNVVVTSALNAATTLPYREDFTTDGEGTRYASNTFSNSGTGAAWLRTSANPYQTAATTQTPTTFSGISNSFYWYGNNTNSTANPSRLGTLQTLPINTAGYVNLDFSLLLGASSGANASWQTADYFKVYYRTGGSSGTWVPILSFRGNSTVAAGQGNLQRDTDPAATASSPAPTGTTLTPALASFSVPLPNSSYGQTLEFQLVLMSDDIRAELAFDNLQLTGTQIVAPTVTTAAPGSITSTSAVLGGSVTNDGNAIVSDRGVVYSTTNTTPIIGGAGATRDANGSGTGSFSKTVASLTPGTTYYVRAYATNTVGTSYGSTVSFTTAATTATVTTAAPASITGTGATLGGNVTADGGAAVTDRGVVYVLGTGTPTTSDTKVQIGTGTGTFSQAITGLRGNTTYTVRAYASNSAGTAYGAVQTFTTPNNPPTAVNDAVTVAEDSGPTTIPVLANDTSAPDGETLTVTAVTQPANGSVTLSGGVVSFTPALDFNGITTFTYTISDGNGGTATATVTVTVTPVNDAPVVTTTTGSTTYTPGGSAVAVDNGLTVADVDNTTLASATVSISSGFVSSQDALSVTVSNGVTGTYTFATGILTLTGTATVAQYQAILRSVTYRNSSATPTTTTRTISLVVNDGSLSSAPATKNITFAATTTVVSIVPTGTSPTNASTVAYTVTFANAVTGLSTSNFTVASTNLTGASIASVVGAGTTYTVTVNTGTLSPGTTGSLQLQFNNSTGISPTVTNVGLTGPAYTIDRTSPTTTISSSAGASGSNTGTAPIPFTVTFSEPITGFAATDAVVTNGAITGNTVSGSGTTYTFTVTPAASGLVTVNVPANGATDAAGNGNLAATQFDITYAQPVTAAPVITTPANGSRIMTLKPTYTGTAPAGSTVTVYVDNVSIGTTIATGGSFSLAQPTNLAETTHTVYATAQTSGSTVSANSNTSTFTVDITAPTVLSINRQSPAANPTNSTVLTYRITFSESVTGVTQDDFSLTSTGTATGSSLAVTAVSTSVYDVTVTGASGNGTLRLDLNSSGTGIADLATNSIVGGYTSGQTYTLDNLAPTTTISTTAANPTSTTPIPFTITFSEPVTGFTASGVTVTNGAITTAITNTGNAYSFSVTPAASGTVTVNVAANVAQDAAGNGNAAASPFSITYLAPVTATSWTGAVSTDWFTAGNWSAGVPTATVDATIAVVSTGRYPLLGSGTASTRRLTLNSGATLTQTGGTLDITGSLTNNGTLGATGGTVQLGNTAAASIVGSSRTQFWNLAVGASGAQLLTSAGATVQRVLTLTGNLATNSNTFTLESNAAGTALVVNSGGVVTGLSTVQRYIDPSLNPGPGYRQYSAPVTGSTVADLATTDAGGRFTPVVNSAYNAAAAPTSVVPFPTVYGYDDSRLSLTNNLSSFDKGFFSPATLGDPLTVGRGYTVNLDASELVDFKGTLTNGDRTLNLTSSRPSYPDGGWQLLGNPYPAPLDYSLVNPADRPGLESAIYVYHSTGPYVGQYRSYVNGFGNPVLPVGQAFFARVATGLSTATMTFRNSQRLTAPNGTAFQRTTADVRPQVQLTLQGTGSPLLDEATVYFEAGASSGFEPAFDAEKLPNPTGLNLSTSLASGRQLSIDGQPELGPGPRVVPLAVGVPAAGVYTFTASQLLNLGAVPVYLRDQQLGTLTDLRQQPTYQFTVSNASALTTTRFELVFSPQQALATVPAALAQQVALYPNPAKTQVTLALPAALGRQAGTVALLDALGRVVRTQELPAGLASHTLLLHDLAVGVYSLRLSTEAGIVVKKLVIE